MEARVRVMPISSRDIAKLRKILNEACRYYNIFCLGNNPLNRSIVNFLASWLESWVLIDGEVDFRDIVSDPSAIEVFLSMHREVFNLARRGLYIYTAIEKSRTMKTLRKLKALTAYSAHSRYRYTE